MVPVYMNVPELASQLGTKPETLREYACRSDDPLPIHYIRGKERSGFVIVAELNEWLERNTCLHLERKDYA
ncbi:hypothetical protein [Gordonibacter massiliensis (ex Traore et al. 2017)]|uniref:hypothetical protein n=1 Tax=Gordonibacter massiliensis (ex Traore et al. 2017) TaxID=1841863 RepID=UPI001C8B0D59|nr:hypothetical protein [Gordonibacter massiliensis (ex Traore et al. 2017)]MBX9032640.1 hypothetical protein [Gordonibacter massiliensis (ex Traore et al. 2017)]